MSADDIKKCGDLRRRIFTVGYSGGMAHLASCFSCVEIIYTLFMKDIMNFDKENADAENRDRFVLSKGHGGLALYSVLELAGLVDSDALSNYLKPGCIIGGEPNFGDVKGIEASTGALGHGFPMAVGMALAQKLDMEEKLDNDEMLSQNPDKKDMVSQKPDEDVTVSWEPDESKASLRKAGESGARTYVLIGDGECQEGSVWETAAFAGANNINNLIAIVDENRLQKTKAVTEIAGEALLKDKWTSFGWNVIEADGHNIDELCRVFKDAQAAGKPTVIIAKTIKGKGVSIMENNPIWHFKMPNRKELKVFMEELKLPEEDFAL